MRVFLLHQFERLLNGYLRLDERTKDQLVALQDKIILLQIEDLGLAIYLVGKETGFELHRQLQVAPTTTIAGNLSAFIHLSRENTNRALFRHSLKISGDLETGERFRTLLTHVDIDWEEQLARFTGDGLAHKLSHVAEQFVASSKKSGDSLALNMTEFLQYESSLLPRRNEVEQFIQDVAALRNDVERFAAKVALLEQEANKLS